MNRIVLLKNSQFTNILSSFFLKQGNEVSIFDVTDENISNLNIEPASTVIIEESLDNYKNKKDWQKKVVNIAKHLKSKEVAHLIVMSSVISVLNKVKRVKDKKTNYLKNLEKDILDLQDEKFVISVVNLPIVFGKDLAEPHYLKMKKLAISSKFYPHINNKLSMIYSENLCEYMRQVVAKRINGDLYPCDILDYSLTDVGNYINRARKSKARLSYLSAILYKFIAIFSSKYRSITRNRFFDKRLTTDNRFEDYHKYTNHDAIFLSEQYNDIIPSRFDLKPGLVSFITPLYNSEKYISETIESVLNQTYQNFEMIIVDDLSSDNSCEVVRKYAEQDSRIKLFRLNKNGGSSKARNEAIRHATGEYICFLDSDDIYDPTFLQEQIQFMRSRKELATYSTYAMFSNNGKWLFKAGKKSTYRSQNYKRNLSALATIYNRKELGTIYMREDLLKAEDYIYWFELFEIVKVIYCNNQCLAYYRITPNSKSRNKKALIKYMWDVFHKYEKHLFITSLFYMFVWGVSGFTKYRKVK